MKIFVIRNLFSIIMAENIIKKYGLTNCLFLIPTKDNEYFSKLKKNISLKDIEIIQYKFSNYPNLKNFFKSLKLIRFYRNKLINFLDEISCTEIFVTNLNDIFERHLVYVGKEKAIVINLFEEGTNLYFKDINRGKIKKIVMNFFKILILKKYKFYFQENKFQIQVDNIFCCFERAYKFNNYKTLTTLSSEFKLKKINNRKVIENLLVTRPLSEDKLLSEIDEIGIILEYVKLKKLTKLYIKAHPRENKEKIKKILYLFKKNEIEVEELGDDVPLEKLVENFDIKRIIGYETGSLIYLSELYGIECDSLIKTVVLKTKLKYFETYYKFYSENFKKINYI